ncbi:SRPBCC domain-containing protein [Desulfuromonas versatilis]|uniref:SRPBCC domain-containing protein n=1 Tax=Desulfuromonas versatilis TaxID=2802975 RepID=A0ABM8HUC5_9BACT|nr:SRPBCC family protein [Desulfuromonas versatilis]BCR05578.1 SRPBCC domain-containing protein [Desulfuromonas versatilis]
MRLYTLQYRQVFPISRETAWEFFSDPANLARITPPWLNLSVTSPLPAEMYPGMLITYRLRPVPGVAVSWVTEITQARKPEFFVDEQRFGPYRFWHHQHDFRPVADGVEMEDLVHYALGFGPLGQVVNRLLVAPRLAEIFRYRRMVLDRRFGSGSHSPKFS